MWLINFTKNLKLGLKLNVLAFLIFSFLLLAMVLATNNSLNSFVRQAGQQNILRDAQTVQIRFGEIEQEVLNNSLALSVIPGLTEAVIARDIKTVRSEILISANRLDFDDVDVLDVNGKRLIDTAETESKDEDRLIRLALLGFDATGAIVKSEAEQAAIYLAAVVPIHDTSGATIGALLASRIIDDEMLARVNIFSGKNLDLGLIVDGRIIASDFESAEDLKYLSAHMLDSNSVEQALIGQTIFASQLITNPAGSPHAMGHIPLTIGADTRAVIGLADNLGELTALQGQLVTTQLVIFVFITLISLVIFALFASNGIVAPIRHLQLLAERLAGGDYTQRMSSGAKDEVGQLANSFDSMAAQLGSLISSLEQRVADRTKDLETVAEVGTTTAAILEIDKLLQTVVDLTKERFNLYHTHIYLMDEAGENLVLAAGAGEPGRIMAAEKRSIPLDREQSLVARSARERQGVTVNDVTEAPDFLPNPLLPDTRSELAVPMIVGGKLIGVFDVQSDQVGRFTDSDISIQTTLAAQVATSIQNVRSFEQAKSQADLESLASAIGQKIQRTTSVEEAMQTAIREVGLALGATRVSANIGTSRSNDGDETSLN